MPKVLTGNQDEEHVKFVQASALARTGGQVGVLLEVIDKVYRPLCAVIDVGQQFSVDAALADESRKTVELAHSRLRDLIDDGARWSLGDSAEDKAQLASAKLDVELKRASVRALEMGMRPCYRMSCHLQRLTLPSGERKWCAWYGPEPVDGALMAFGDTPEKALSNFDLAVKDSASHWEQLPPDENTRRTKHTDS
jgi:hypothetical protein